MTCRLLSALTASATAVYVLPVPAGPTANTMSDWRAASTSRAWPGVLAWTVPPCGVNRMASWPPRRWSPVPDAREVEDRVDVVLGEVPVPVEDDDELADDPLDPVHLVLGAAELELVAARDDAGVGKGRLDLAEVDVVEPEEQERLGAADGHGPLDGVGGELGQRGGAWGEGEASGQRAGPGPVRPPGDGRRNPQGLLAQKGAGGGRGAEDRAGAGGRTPAMTPPDRPALVVPFTKMDGAGNDFVVLDNRFLRFAEDELAALARRACPRRTGVGADGLLALEDADAEGAHFRMRYRNADGSLGDDVRERGPVPRPVRRPRRPRRPRRQRGRRRGPPGSRSTPTADGTGPRSQTPTRVSGPVVLHVPPPRDFGPTGLRDAPTPRSSRVYRIWTGTEHAVVFVADVEREDVAAAGGRPPVGRGVPPGRDERELRPARRPGPGPRTDVREGRRGRDARVRDGRARRRPRRPPQPGGPGESGADAGRQRVEVEMPGGTLAVGFRAGGGEVADLTLEGPARTTFEGTLEWRG